MSVKTGKRPSFQFYPSDWLRDTALRMCSLEARGLWIDMLAYMHEGCPYGHLKVGTKDILPGVLARMVGTDEQTAERLIAELEESGVLSRTDNGTIYSRRMVRDEQIRCERAEGGKESQKNPNVPRRKTDGLKPGGYASTQPSSSPSGCPSTPSLDRSFGGSPSSSSSSSSSSSLLKNKDTSSNAGVYLNGAQEGFDIFWKAFPKKRNKGHAEKSWAKLKPDDLLLGLMLAKIEQAKQTPDWRNENGRYIPCPASWLNARAWEDEVSRAE